jgi:pyruvate dehydrogenase E1 component alpha subunit
MSDPAKYRTKEELAEYKSLDPIESALDVIKKEKYATATEIEAIQNKVKAQVAESVEFSENSPFPDPSELYTEVYAEPNYPFIVD